MTIKYPKLSEKEFLFRYLEIMNSLLPESQRLIPSEIELVIEFAILPEDRFQYQRFGSLAKNKVIESFSSQGRTFTKVNINNKLYSLLEKKFLVRDEDKIIYLPKHLLQALSAFRKDLLFNMNIIFANGNIEN
ncbi:MAG: hypothetical protein BWY21_02156 [Parcubacteria group bacterium ADurb.Bin216]|nr:MAG: hypothetical protein BWY21_02156 [Parcubacteria group bacterium ADurb.Bin216]